MREMTDAEKEFVNRTLSQHGSGEDNGSTVAGSLLNKTPRKQGKKKPWQKVSNWAISLLLIPLGFTGLLFYGFMRVEGVIGNGSLAMLAKNPLGDGFSEQAAAQGMEWLPQLVTVYDNKAFIVGGVFTVTIILIGVILIIDHVVNKGRKNAENN